MNIQIQKVSTNYNQTHPCFKALKSIKFCNELQNNTYAQNELLKVFEKRMKRFLI